MALWQAGIEARAAACASRVNAHKEISMAEADVKDPEKRRETVPSTTARTPRRSIQEQLDEALADSFPASDPVSLVTSQTEEDWVDAAEPVDKSKATGP
jgi:hypothetical protein